MDGNGGISKEWTNLFCRATNDGKFTNTLPQIYSMGQGLIASPFGGSPSEANVNISVCRILACSQPRERVLSTLTSITLWKINVSPWACSNFNLCCLGRINRHQANQDHTNKGSPGRQFSWLGTSSSVRYSIPNLADGVPSPCLWTFLLKTYSIFLLFFLHYFFFLPFTILLSHHIPHIPFAAVLDAEKSHLTFWNWLAQWT